MSRKRLLVLSIGLVCAVVALGLGGVIALAVFDTRPMIEFAAQHMLDRRLSIGRIRIGWGNPLSVELTDVSLANASWGSEPEMLRIDALSAEIDLRSLLHGVLRYDKLRITKPRLLLERGAGRGANWRFPGSGSPPWGHLALIPKDRTQFPTLIDMALQDGVLILRVPGSHDIRLDFHELKISAPGDDQSATLAVDGAYNGLPARIAGETASFDVMRDRTIPFGVQWTLSTTADSIAFTGTMTDPLNFDGVDGKMRIDAPKIGELFKFVGGDLQSDIPVSIAAAFTKQDTHWQLSDSAGAVAKNRFAGTLAMNEAGHGQPDAVVMDITFPTLDLKSLLASDQKSATARSGDPISLHIDEHSGETIDARIAAKRLTYGTVEIADFAIHANSAPSRISVAALSFTVAGGRVEASGSAHAVKDGSQITANIALSGGNAAAIATLAGAAGGQIAGTLDGRITVEATGKVLTDAVKRSRGQMVLAMTNGRVTRDFIEKASTDLRVLFRTSEGWVTASCLLGVIELRDGIATIAQLRMRTPDTTLVGSGEADLAAERLDMTIKADSAGSRIFALDVPLRIAGDFKALNVRPAFGSSATAPREAMAEQQMPAEMQALVATNPCRTEK